MLFVKYRSLVEGIELEDPKTDEKNGKKLGQYRLSRSAVYMPDGGYVPLRCVTGAEAGMGNVHVSGCCIGSLPVHRVVVKTEKGSFQFIFNSEKGAQRALEEIRAGAGL